MPTLTRKSDRIGPGVPYDAFLGCVWSFAALALIFLAVRLYSRIRGPGRLFWDDGFVIFAFILVLVTAALWQWMTPTMYFLLNVAAGFEQPTADLIDRQKIWLKVSLAVELFFYTSLTSVKLSFLFFFRRLGHNVTKQRYIWWPIFLFTLAAWFTAIGNVQYHCLIGDAEMLNGWCDTKPAIDFTTITLAVNCALDVFSDFLIMLIPIIMLWNIRMRWAKKIAFMGLFSLSLLTMVIAIVRTADIKATKWTSGQNDPTYLWLWSAIEPCIAIVVSCLSAFPQLFAQSSRSAKPVYTPSETYRKMISRIRARKKDSHFGLYDLSTLNQTDNFEYTRTTDPDTASQDSRQPVLVPGSPAPVATCYTGAPDMANVGPQNGITQGFEYHVTHHKA